MSTGELDTCRSQADSMDPTGAVRDACDRAYGTSGGGCWTGSDTQYGAVFFDSSTTYNWDGSSSLQVPMYGAVYCCTKTSATNTQANDISLGLNITVNSTSLPRSCGDSNMQLGPKSTSSIMATVPASALNQASCDTSGNCTLVVDVTSRLGGSKLATYNSYLKFKKGGGSTPCTCTCCDCNPSGCSSATVTPIAYVSYAGSGWKTGTSNTYSIPSGSSSVTLSWQYDASISVTGDCTQFHWSTTHDATGGNEWACSWDTSKTVGTGTTTVSVGATTNAANGTVAPGGGTWFCGTITIGSNNSSACVYVSAPEAPTENTFTLSYNLNGGTGYFPSQSCTTTGTSCSITIHSGSPAKTDYNFANWWSGYTSYAPGSSITIGADTTLYAHWSQNTHTLNYDANGGSGAPSSQTHSDANSSYTFTISSTTPTREGYRFMGWATYSWATSATYQPGGTISVTTSTTLYAVWEQLDVATFNAPEITITSTDLNYNSDTGTWRGLGDKTSYAVTATYHIKRTNSTPYRATSEYGYAAYNSDSDWYYYYLSKDRTSNALTNASVQDIPVAYSVDVSNGSTATKCFYLTYDSEVYYTKGTNPERVGVKSTGRTKKCISVYNPYNNSAAFSGSVSISNGAGLSGDGVNRTGNGYRSTFTITPNYSITRTDSFNPPLTATSNYALNSTAGADYSYYSYPSDSATTTSSNALYNAYYAYYGYTKTQSWSGSAATIDINIGGDAQKRCYYLRYDSSVLYYDNARQSGNFAGRNYACVSITNPANTDTIYFTATTDNGTFSDNTYLERSDGNRVGKINNHQRNTTSTDDSVIGKWEDIPTAINGTYLGNFTHTLRRTDSSSTILGKTMNASVDWQIQYSTPSNAPYINAYGKWVVSGTWSNYTSSADNNNIATSGTESFGGSGSKIINTQPKITAAQGQIRYYCQRLAYTPSITYATISVADKTDYGVNNGTKADMAYTDPLCVTLKNPAWQETDGTTYNHIIDVTGQPDGAEFPAGDFIQSGNNYETLVLNPTLYIHHAVERHDDANKPNSYDETDAADENGYVLFGNNANKKFWQSSAYSSASILSVTSRLKGDEAFNGGDHHFIERITGGIYDGSLLLTLNARSKSDSDTWHSTLEQGASVITFNNANNDRYTVLAGQTSVLDVATNLEPTRWKFSYKKINLSEYYNKSGDTPTLINAGTAYDRIEKVSTAPTQIAPDDYTSSPLRLNITRPYNFEIIDATVANAADIDDISFTGNTFSLKYNIKVKQQNTEHQYITDPSHTDAARYVSVITYILPADTDPASDALANSVTGGVETGVCNRFAGIAKSGSCRELTGSHTEKLSAGGDDTYNPTKGASDTHFRHVYSVPTTEDQTYQLSYTTSSITVENSDGTPLSPGEKFCVALAIRNYSSVSSDYFISNSNCHNVSKRPAVQVWGGSVITDGGVSTNEAPYNIGGNSIVFGSWSDFAISAKKDVKKMSSGASTISCATSSALIDRNPLTIANNRSDLGHSNIAARGELVEKALLYFRSSPDIETIDDLYDLCGVSCPDGKGAIIYRNTSETLDITHNLYNNNIFNQIIIIAKNINIDASVTHLDAWLIATDASGNGGVIDTCAKEDDKEIVDNDLRCVDGSADSCAELSASHCVNKLDVNGVLTAGQIKFKRTTGGDVAAGTIKDPAEIVNFSPTTIVWGYGASRFETNPRAVYMKELPVRY